MSRIHPRGDLRCLGVRGPSLSCMLDVHGRFSRVQRLVLVLYRRQLQLLALELEDGLGPLQLAA
jgi:hypothetical protein